MLAAWREARHRAVRYTPRLALPTLSGVSLPSLAGRA
jgi:hypothetical protein